MGTSITSLVECKKSDGSWKVNDYSPIDDNYILFSILSDVRNHDNIIPISQPRGLPEDLDKERHRPTTHLEPIPMNSEEYLTYFGSISCSYHTLKDLKEYDWDQIVTMKRFVDVESYKEWMSRGKIGKPIEYSLSACSNISNSEMEEVIRYEEEGIPHIKARPLHTIVNWEASCKDLCPEFYNETIPALEKISEKYGGDENVRIIFCFW